MRVKFLTPVKGYAYFEGDITDIPSKVAEKLITEQKVEAIREESKVGVMKESKKR